MDNQDSSTGCVVTHGGFSGETGRSSDSSKLRSELPSLLEPPPKLLPLKKSSLRLIALRLAGKVSSLQQKTEAGIRKAEPLISAKTRNQGVFFNANLTTQWWLRRGIFMVTGNLMRPVFRNPFELPPLRFETRAVATLTHQRLPA